MFKRILLPLDGSEQSEKALAYGEELAVRLGSELVLYHVHRHDQQEQEHLYSVYLESIAARLRGKLRKTGAKVTTQVEAGDPQHSICDLVGKNEIDLIIMAASSSSGMKVGKALGSVTDHVCRTVPIPVMLIRPESVRPTGSKGRLLKRLLIPLDGSELSRLALSVGEGLAAELKLSITIFQMASMIRLYNDGSEAAAYGIYERFNETEKRRVSTEMQETAKGLRAKGIKATSKVTSGFDAAYEIIELSKKAGVDLVVMSTHGRTGLGRWVFGNVAEKVLRHGQTPLLLVHSAAG